jgi:hypothetical protein
MTLPPYAVQKGSARMAIFRLKDGGRIPLSDSHLARGVADLKGI